MEKRVDLRLEKEQTLEKGRREKKKGEEENSEGFHGDNGESNGERRLRKFRLERERERRPSFDFRGSNLGIYERLLFGNREENPFSPNFYIYIYFSFF